MSWMTKNELFSKFVKRKGQGFKTKLAFHLSGVFFYGRIVMGEVRGGGLEAKGPTILCLFFNMHVLERNRKEYNSVLATGPTLADGV